MTREPVVVVGGGLAGVEAALALARRGERSRLYEMKPLRFSPAHRESALAELVCSNSLGSILPTAAAGLLKDEIALLGSEVVRAARASAVPAGSALAVDRARFAALLTERVEREPLIELVRQEISAIPDAPQAILATGPLTSDAFAAALSQLLGQGFLYFYDAIAPIVEADSIDMSKAFLASRYDKGTADYLNLPLTEEEYRAFVAELLAGEKTPLHAFEEEKHFEACMPVETLAERGPDTLAFGPMRPVGLVDPHTGRRPYAVVQLRREDSAGRLYNLVGFQTKLKYDEQRRVFRLIPGLQNAEFARLGCMHRNTFIDSPALLDRCFRLRADPRFGFAGTLAGAEGYVEAAATGLWAGLNAARIARGEAPVAPPPETMLGALTGFIAGADPKRFQPISAAFGLLPPLEGRRPKKLRKQEHYERAIAAMRRWIAEMGEEPAA